MAWPTPQEYNEAIQNPVTAFVDPELRAGQPVLTPLGLPRPITGGFASVYQMVCAQQRVWAVRCFLRDFGDHQERYAAISAHLARVNLPYMVNFAFLADGIRVGGRLHPILKMEWVEGEPFLAYVERSLTAPNALLDLAQQWVQMAQTLARAGIAHGDLQHGNVIVVRGRLKLIDYDGMYVPALAGRRSHEVGHRNYQHPQRTETLFNPEIDHFSTWIIYSSLVALAAQPTLWRQLRGGDECLIFRREDFVNPSQSATLAALEQSGDVRLGRLAELLRGLLALAPTQIPPIDGQFDLNAMRSRPTAAWVRDHVSGSPVAMTPSTTGASRPAPIWITDFIAVSPPATPGATPGAQWQPRLVVVASALFALAAWSLFGLGAVGLAAPALLSIALLAGNTGYLALDYWRAPAVAARRDVRRRLATVARQQRTATRSLATAERELAYIRLIQAQQYARIDRLIGKEQQVEQQELAARNQRRQRALDDLQVQRHRLQQETALTIQRLETHYHERIGDIDRQLGALQQSELAAQRRLLEQRRQKFVKDFLHRQKIEKALISGIGPGIKEQLRQHGIVRVTDVTAQRLATVPGVGAARADVLLSWRQRVEELAWQGAPTHLDRRDERTIHREHERLHARLTKARERLEGKLTRAVTAVREQTARRATTLATQETQIEERHRAQVATLRKRHREQVAALRTERAQVEQQAATFAAAMEQAISRLQQTQQRLEWEQATLTAELNHQPHADFPGYVRRALLPR
ncbi:MAG TPA: hypothetical protein DCL15_00965 [Chloroflexi bacterium]|nr:hypothetical protein [Chloroflexota bacterium]HHW85466.1 hypothetical protein [Chloroflexota bacterium]